MAFGICIIISKKNVNHLYVDVRYIWKYVYIYVYLKYSYMYFVFLYSKTFAFKGIVFKPESIPIYF